VPVSKTLACVIVFCILLLCVYKQKWLTYWWCSDSMRAWKLTPATLTPDTVTIPYRPVVRPDVPA